MIGQGQGGDRGGARRHLEREREMGSGCVREAACKESEMMVRETTHRNRLDLSASKLLRATIPIVTHTAVPTKRIHT